MNSQVGRRRIVIGGISLIVATVLFAAVFIYLASAFDYPAVLERPASEVLPRLLSLGATGRLVWLLYGVIPLLLIPTALASTKPSAERCRRSDASASGSQPSARSR
ncbi:MAG: hypothetical protein U0Q11_26795 [Vicinamibacterales bacterium]